MGAREIGDERARRTEEERVGEGSSAKAKSRRNLRGKLRKNSQYFAIKKRANGKKPRK